MLLHEHQRISGCRTPQECLWLAPNTSNAKVHMRAYPRSLVAAYLRNEPPTLTGGCAKSRCFIEQHGHLLEPLLARWGPREPLGISMHVRLGDVIDDSTDHSAADFLCSRTHSHARPFAYHPKWTHYVKTLAFYSRVANELTGKARLRKLLPLHVFYGAGPFPPGYDGAAENPFPDGRRNAKGGATSYPRSCTYVRAVIAYLNARGVPIVEHADGTDAQFGPDESFAAMATSKVLVITGGGYGQLAASMVLRRNGTVLGISDGFDTCSASVDDKKSASE